MGVSVSPDIGPGPDPGTSPCRGALTVFFSPGLIRGPSWTRGDVVVWVDVSGGSESERVALSLCEA